MSKFLTLNQRDILKGLFIAVLTSILGGLYSIIKTGLLPTPDQLYTIGMAGAGAGLSYLIKNLCSNSNGVLLASEPKNV